MKRTMLASKLSGCGHRLGPDQNGAPELVVWNKTLNYNNRYLATNNNLSLLLFQDLQKYN